MNISDYGIPDDHLDPVQVVEIAGSKVAYRQPPHDVARAIRKKVNDDYAAADEGTVHDRSEVVYGSHIAAIAATLLHRGDNITEEQARVLYFNTGGVNSPYVNPAMEILGMRTTEDSDPLESRSSESEHNSD